MIIITSAGFVSQELGSIFGKIPSSFLPARNRRLFQIQNETLPKEEDIFITLPLDFELDLYDTIILNELGFSIIKVPNNLTLGESVVFAINSIGRYNETLRILHGDTVITDIDFNINNAVSVGPITDNYNWADLTNMNIDKQTFTGYFSFEKTSKIVKSIIESEKDFVNGVKKYFESESVNLVTDVGWFDFGHVNTFFRSKSKITTERVFNNLKIENRYFVKKSVNHDKIIAETSWFNNIPNKVRLYTPHVLSDNFDLNSPEYAIEYLHHSTLNDLYIFGRLPKLLWMEIFNSINELFDVFNEFPCESFNAQVSFKNSLIQKTYSRLKEFNDQTKIDLNQSLVYNGECIPSINSIIKDISKSITAESNYIISHGDLCFSNMLYDFRSQMIKVIDPRGMTFEGENSIYGDSRYDIAKLSHSVIGLYDFIIGGYYDLNVCNHEYELTIHTPKHVKEIQKLFIDFKFSNYKYSNKEIYSLIIHLFFSMLPLHYEDFRKQQAILANALRLYTEYLKLK